MKNKEKIRSASWYPKPMDEGDVIQQLKKRVKELEAKIEELEGEIQEISEDAAGIDL